MADTKGPRFAVDGTPNPEKVTDDSMTAGYTGTRGSRVEDIRRSMEAAGGQVLEEGPGAGTTGDESTEPKPKSDSKKG